VQDLPSQVTAREGRFSGEDAVHNRMQFLRKLFSLGGCTRLEMEGDDENETSDNISDDEETCFDHNLLVHSDELVCDILSDMSYMPGPWRSPSLGTKVMDRVRDSPRLAKRAMSKMTSPMVSKRKKEDEIYIITLDIMHSSGLVVRGEGQSDAW
jgi:hypothetical protein